MSSHDLAHRLGLGWDAANKLLNDDTYDPPLSTLLQVAHALNLCSIEELFGPFPLAEILNKGRS
ncbi:MAG: helix-turn-helix transcriptional regulator [Calditrichaeota bacterium]|nr:helix-turn-helix transcriptional regulator [Calditrichota bacterium]